MPDVSPLYQTVRPDGSVEFTFPGVTTLYAGSTTNPPTNRRVQWVREDISRALVAQMYAYEQSPYERFQLHSVQQNAGDHGTMLLTQDQQFSTAEIELDTDPTQPRATIFAHVNDYITGLDTKRRVVESDGWSDWQWSDSFYGVSRGGPYATAAPPNSTSGDSFNVTKPGLYLFTFNGSCYQTSGAPLIYLDLYIDGSLASNTQMVLNLTNVHTSLPGGFATWWLNRGTHYVWQRVTGGAVNTDGGDRVWWAATPA